MGYYTCYRLEIIEGNPEGVIEALRDHSEEANRALTDEGDTEQEAKWYESDEDMKWLSTTYPEHLFMLEGEGEESGDLWRQYWRNGKCQHVSAEIVYEDFDPNKLK